MILVVDDEDSVRALVTQILEKAGFEVVDCADAREAVRLYRRQEAKINLVVLDLLMPSMGGHSLLQTLLRVNPGLKVLVLSGTSAESGLLEAERLGAQAILRKPFKGQDLVSTVRHMLAGPRFSR